MTGKGSRLSGTLLKGLPRPLAAALFDRSLASTFARGEEDQEHGAAAGHVTAHHVARAALGRRLVFTGDLFAIEGDVRPHAPSHYGTKPLADCFVGRGSWEGYVRPVEDNRVYEEMRQLAVARHAYRDMPVWHDYLRQAQGGQPVYRNNGALDGEEALTRYFDHYLALLESVESQGYRSASGWAAPWHDRTGLRRASVAEVGIVIDAEGRPLRFRGGQHRFAIAHLLGIASLPFEIVAIHRDHLVRLVERFDRPPGPALRHWLETVGPFGGVSPTDRSAIDRSVRG